MGKAAVTGAYDDAVPKHPGFCQKSLNLFLKN
jgi:hypothetical protein